MEGEEASSCVPIHLDHLSFINGEEEGEDGGVPFVYSEDVAYGEEEALGATCDEGGDILAYEA